MNILIYRYGSICEPDFIQAFQNAGLTVLEETAEITNKGLSESERVTLVEQWLQKEHPLFVFSINFFPVLADLCHIYRTPYLCQTVDCPVPELFSASLQHDTNRIFCFDRKQYETFHPYNESGIFYLPLASACERFDKVISAMTPDDRAHYTSDISFVGSLYSEKNPLAIMNNLTPETCGFIDGLTEAALCLYGYNPIEEALTDTVVAEIKGKAPSFYVPRSSLAPSDRHVAAHYFLGYEAAYRERVRTLNLLAKHFSVDLYTGSDPTPLEDVHVRDRIQTLTEMPKVFSLSKINLNMTIKPICTGLPLRIFDILGCGGFCMTNYQEELTEYFTIGEDLEAYTSLDELVEKCAFYLSHDDLRERIAANGREKVASKHTYPHRIREMLKESFPG